MGGFVDIHCHLVPDIDDGAADLEESLGMARQSVEQGVETIVCTPHQLGSNGHIRGDVIRARVAALQAHLDAASIPLRVLPGADVRIDDGMIDGLASGDVVSLGDHRRHVLLELPHELYFPMEGVLEELDRLGMVGVLSHPERNAGLLAKQDLVDGLIERGCLMQVTAGSLIGGFGADSQAMAERMAQRGMLHFLSTDAHGAKRRRPRLAEAFRAAEKLAGETAARLWCRDNPQAVAEGRDVTPGVVRVSRPRRGWSFFSRGAA